jgi:sialate O-acetylesterase
MYKIAFCWLSLICFFNAGAQQKKVRVACIGNSITYGWGLPNRSQSSYPAVLQDKLGAAYEVRNFGHSGATLLSKGHNPYIKTAAYGDMLSFKPDIAIIELGLNDTDPRNFPHYRDEFLTDFHKLLDTIRSCNASAKIFICKMTPVFTGHQRFMSSTYEWYKILQEKIEQVARSRNLPVIDLNEALHNRPDLFTDAATIHPDQRGTYLIGQSVYRHLSGDFGGLQLPPLFTDHMILQRQQPIRIWGLANAGDTVSVGLGLSKSTAIAGVSGKWQVELPEMNASFQPLVLQISDGHRNIVVKDILIGDVWVCSGQSNMDFPMSQCTNSSSLLSKTDISRPIRLFSYKVYAPTDQRPWTEKELEKANELNFFSGSWQQDSKEAAKQFSAVGYSFGNSIFQHEKIPVGLIQIAVGGSPLISWVSREGLLSDPLFMPALANWRQSDYIMSWCRERANLNLKNATTSLQRHTYEPCFNFEAAIARLVPYAIKGIVWYQGESDTENCELYQKLFPLFVQDWRRHWKANLPFYYVQLPSLERPSWNYFRDAQRRLLSQVPGSYMAITSDLGHPTDVHFPDKIPVGERLARLALNKTYGRSIVASGPLVKSARMSGKYIRIDFNNSQGLNTLRRAPLQGFELVTDRGAFIPVGGLIKNNSVYIPIPPRSKIDKVVYAWQPFTTANLINSGNLPASTFIMSLNDVYNE